MSIQVVTSCTLHGSDDDSRAKLVDDHVITMMPAFRVSAAGHFPSASRFGITRFGRLAGARRSRFRSAFQWLFLAALPGSARGIGIGIG